MEQRGLDADHVMVYRSRAEELSGVMVALTVGLTRSVRCSLLKMGLRKTAAATEACAVASAESLLDR
jgi:hypothetical protein